MGSWGVDIFSQDAVFRLGPRMVSTSASQGQVGSRITEAGADPGPAR